MTEHRAGCIKAELAAELGCPCVPKLIRCPVRLNAELLARPPDRESIRLRAEPAVEPALRTLRTRSIPPSSGWRHRGNGSLSASRLSLRLRLRRREERLVQWAIEVVTQDGLPPRPDRPFVPMAQRAGTSRQIDRAALHVARCFRVEDNTSAPGRYTLDAFHPQRSTAGAERSHRQGLSASNGYAGRSDQDMARP